MPYLDYTDEWLRDLTRQRRLERELSRARVQPVRFAVVGGYEFAADVTPCKPSSVRSKARAKIWRQAQWKAGNRRCAYCTVKLIPIPKRLPSGVPVPLAMATVDHKDPITLGGDDAPWNFAMACFGCNNRKGFMTEAEFRALLAAETRLTA